MWLDPLRGQFSLLVSVSVSVSVSTCCVGRLAPRTLWPFSSVECGSPPQFGRSTSAGSGGGYADADADVDVDADYVFDFVSVFVSIDCSTAVHSPDPVSASLCSAA